MKKWIFFRSSFEGHADIFSFFFTFPFHLPGVAHGYLPCPFALLCFRLGGEVRLRAVELRNSRTRGAARAVVKTWQGFSGLQVVISRLPDLSAKSGVSSQQLGTYLNESRALGESLSLTQKKTSNSKRDLPKIWIFPGLTKFIPFLAVFFGSGWWGFPNLASRVMRSCRKPRPDQRIGSTTCSGCKSGSALDSVNLLWFFPVFGCVKHASLLSVKHWVWMGREDIPSNHTM